MKRPKRAAKHLAANDQQPFCNAEEAWMWYVRCQKARDEGARSIAGLAEIARPCEPDDLYRVVDRLFRNRSLSRHHLRVLFSFGWMERPPDPRRADEAPLAPLWREALDHLADILVRKGIVSCTKN